MHITRRLKIEFSTEINLFGPKDTNYKAVKILCIFNNHIFRIHIFEFKIIYRTRINYIAHIAYFLLHLILIAAAIKY